MDGSNGSDPIRLEERNGIWEYRDGEYRERWVVRKRVWVQLKTAKTFSFQDLEEVLHRFRWVREENNFPPSPTEEKDFFYD